VALFFLATTTIEAQTPNQYFARSYAIVVGIKDYQYSGRWSKLNNSENDADEITSLLHAQGFQVKTFKSRQATKQAIESYIEDTLAPSIQSDDRVVFYFSGHGETLPKGGKEWGYVIPYDASEKSSSWISMKRLQILAEMMGSARHQLFIFDACFGGTFGLKSSLSSTPENIPNYVSTVAQAKARQYLTAGGPKERTPAESSLQGYENYSFFTAYLVKALREDAGDLNKDGVITTSELDAYLGPAARSQYNTPRGGCFPGHEQGNFVFRASQKQYSAKQNLASGILKGNQPQSLERDSPIISSFAPNIKGLLSDKKREEIRDFSSYLGLSYSSTRDDIISKFGEPDREINVTYIEGRELYYFGEDVMIAQEKSNRTVILELSLNRNDTLSRLRQKGIVDPKIEYIGMNIADIKALLGEPNYNSKSDPQKTYVATYKDIETGFNAKIGSGVFAWVYFYLDRSTDSCTKLSIVWSVP